MVIALLVMVLVKLSLPADPKPAVVLTEKEAIAEMLAQYPQLAVYQNTDLPPSSIESKKAGQDGWYLGFIRRGSGVPGILDAKCYYMSNAKIATLIGEYNSTSSSVVDFINLETCEPVVEEIISPATSTTSAPKPTPVPVPVPAKDTGLRLGEFGNFGDVSIRPLSIEEDSRCPVDVNCIQAGTVRVKIEVVSGAGTNIAVVKLGQEQVVSGMNIILTSVTPTKNSKINVAEAEYLFNFKVTNQDAPVVTNPPGKCYVGGCSSQLCSDQSDMVSTCEFREEYACYQGATCERQTSGQCGWTATSELQACLDSAR